MSGYVDLQVNGFAGIDFNSDDLTDDDLTRVCHRLVEDGAIGVLPTIITAPIDKMQRRIARVAEAIESHPDASSLFCGIHVEGPFISPTEGFVGAHPTADVKPADLETAKRLIDAGAGHVRLLTLAPEHDTGAVVTRWLAGQGIAVAGGHSDASIDDLRLGIDNGLKLFTHLGNGCPGQMHRHDNIIQRVLSVADRLRVSIIADGHHVPWFALRNYLSAIPSSGVIIVSDAITAAGLGPGQHWLSDQIVHVDDDLAAWSADRKHFAGSATSLGRMRHLMRQQLGITDYTIQQWSHDNPLTTLA